MEVLVGHTTVREHISMVAKLVLYTTHVAFRIDQPFFDSLLESFLKVVVRENMHLNF